MYGWSIGSRRCGQGREIAGLVRIRLVLILFGIGLCSVSCRRHEEMNRSGSEDSPKTPQIAADFHVQGFRVRFQTGNESFDENTYLVFDQASKQGVIIDPGGRSEDLERFIESQGISIKAILNTHGHSDHTGANGLYRVKYRTDVYAHEADSPLFTKEDNKPTKWFDHEGDYTIGNTKLRVFFTPGHTPGSACFLFGNYLFSGDTLFRETIGRTSDATEFATLVSNIKKKLFQLPASTIVYAGHDESSTIGHEMESNLFLRDGPTGSEDTVAPSRSAR